LKRMTALARGRSEYAAPGTALETELTIEAVRHTVGAKVVPLPFFSPPRKTATPPAEQLPEYFSAWHHSPPCGRLVARHSDPSADGDESALFENQSSRSFAAAQDDAPKVFIGILSA